VHAGYPFDGDRYQFEVVVKTVESAASHGVKLREIFGEWIILTRTERLSEPPKDDGN
jgi:hypothetical protein